MKQIIIIVRAGVHVILSNTFVARYNYYEKINSITSNTPPPTTMCGIIALFGRNATNYVNSVLHELKHRGPDSSVLYKNEACFTRIVFHRLAIMDTHSYSAAQPFEDQDTVAVCNGEIYNFQELIQKYNLAGEYKSHSDCEIILHLYKRLGFQAMVNEFRGVFAIVLLDKKTQTVYIARDRIGIRPLYYGFNVYTGVFAFASEPIALVHSGFVDIDQFSPSTIGTFQITTDGHCQQFETFQYWSLDMFKPTIFDFDSACKQVHDVLVDSVQIRMKADRPVGCLLSGGLDSSLIAALVNAECKKNNTVNSRLYTFSVGMPGSDDLRYARVVADFLGTIHHEVLLSEQDFLNAIPDVVRCLATYDITTIRASVGMWLVSKYIREHTDVKVIYSGELADELFQGYMYFHRQPTPVAADIESRRLVQDVHYFDVLRADRTTAAFGLELREPFCDQRLVELVYNIDPILRAPTMGKEKYLVRKAFESSALIPHEVLWRPKCAFSDGVSSVRKYWYQMIQDYVTDRNAESKVPLDGTSEALFKLQLNMLPCDITNKTVTPESWYYLRLFSRDYATCYNFTPYYWLPKWCGNIAEPSATVLTI